jgi:hypothetical protein
MTNSQRRCLKEAPPDDDSDWICPIHEEDAALTTTGTVGTVPISCREEELHLIELFSGSKSRKNAGKNWVSSHDSAAADR